MTHPGTSPDALRVLEAQLGRMRGMLFGYYDLFYRLTGTGVLAIAALFVAAFLPQTRAAGLILPFVILYVGFRAASLYSYVTFARTYAAALERRINAALGEEVLVAHRLEEAYFGAPGDPRVVAASLRRPLTMLAAETWHFTVVGAGLFAVSVLIGDLTARQLGEPWASLYVPVTVGWALLNGAFLAWYFVARRDQRAIQAILDDAYGAPVADPEERG